MATFAHDPSRVHPPFHEGEPHVDHTAREPSVTDITQKASDSAPRTQTNYVAERVLVSVAIGGTGEPHRIVYVTTDRNFRNQGYARDAMNYVLADIDADGRDSTIFIRNVDTDCDVPRLTAFFESLGYVQTTLDPDENCPQLAREHP